MQWQQFVSSSSVIQLCHWWCGCLFKRRYSSSQTRTNRTPWSVKPCTQWSSIWFFFMLIKIKMKMLFALCEVWMDHFIFPLNLFIPNRGPCSSPLSIRGWAHTAVGTRLLDVGKSQEKIEWMKPTLFISCSLAHRVTNVTTVVQCVTLACAAKTFGLVL